MQVIRYKLYKFIIKCYEMEPTNWKNDKIMKKKKMTK